VTAPPPSWMYRAARHSEPSGTFIRPRPGVRRSRRGVVSGSSSGLAAAGTLAAGLLVTAVLVAGCGSTPTTNPAAATARPAPPPLATSFAGTAGSGWVIVQMGESAAQHNDFWQMFVRSAATARWRQATPAGVAANGGLEAAAAGGSLVTGFRPSQDLTFSPLAASSNGGVSWSSSGPVYPGLADAPDALAAGSGGRLIALTSGGGAESSTSLGAKWARLTSVKALASTPAGRACGLTGLTAAAFGGSGAPVLAGSCGRPGAAGIFADSGGTWRAAGPALPAALARRDVEVLALASEGPGLVALLAAGSGRDATVTAAWSAGAGRWTLSAPLLLGAGQLTSTAVGSGGAVGVTLSTGRGETLAGPGASWRTLPALPRGTAALALAAGGQADAIVAHGGAFGDWRLGPAAAGWSLAQTINVTIPYGSSG